MKKKLIISSILFILLFSGYGIYSSFSDRIVYIPEHQKRHQLLLQKFPEDLSFAGESVELTSPDSYRKFEKEIKVNTTNNSSTRLLMKSVRVWLPQIAAIIKENKLPEDFKYIAIAESNLTNSVSHRGAAGFWQFTETTGKGLGLEINEEIDERYHPIKSTQAACKYFKVAYKKFGSWTAAAASYNRGINGLDKAFKEQNVNSYYELALNDETSRYMFRIAALKDLIKNPRKYGIRIKRSAPRHTKKIKIKESIPNLAEFAKSEGSNMQTLKELNPWLLKNTPNYKGQEETLRYLPSKIACYNTEQIGNYFSLQLKDCNLAKLGFGMVYSFYSFPKIPISNLLP